MEKTARRERDEPDMGQDSIPRELRGHINAGTLVLFIGNGVMRVPTWVDPGGAPSSGLQPEGQAGASWQQYMEDLWLLVRPRPSHEAPDDLDFAEFQRLSAPRQAEWFDRRAVRLLDSRDDDHLAQAIRLHLLGCNLHPQHGVPTNPLLETTAKIVTQLSENRAGDDVHLITTNVDCALEQNIARLIEQDTAGSTGVLTNPQLFTRTSSGYTAIWRREPVHEPTARIHIWKIHGCLHALCRQFSGQWPAIKEGLERLVGQSDYHALWGDRFAGHVPERTLLPTEEEKWKNMSPAAAAAPEDRSVPSVFSQTEYVSVLEQLLVVHLSSETPLREVGKIFKHHPMLFIGYDLHEVDIDVIAALHKHLSPDVSRFTLRYRKSTYHERHEEERLRQMQIKWWSFALSAVAFARMPGDLRRTSDHEWRRRHPQDSDEALRSDLDHPWRVHLQRHAASEWMRSQLERVLELLGEDHRAERTAQPPRLVVAGLASQWYAFALKRPSDLPSRRRVSASLAAVDARVPGGSGLVPVMVAAAAAGPQSVGRLAFLTNTPETWTGWPEIEEFCLSAGIDVRPLGDVPADAGARTSHVLLFDPDQLEDTSTRSRQRMIMDVDRLIDLTASDQVDARDVKAPQVAQLEDFGWGTDLLFADKLAQASLIARWQGPVIFETGSSGTELLDLDRPPHVWTAGFGSFIRTLSSSAAGRKSDGKWEIDLPQDWRQAMCMLREHPDLELFTRDGSSDKGHYIAHINSFDQKLWGEGVTHRKELEYGKWVQSNWTRLRDPTLNLLFHPDDERRLLRQHETLGTGILVTLHESGLMSYWRLPGQDWRSIVVRAIPTQGEGVFGFDLRCTSEGGDGQQLVPLCLRITAEKVHLSLPDVPPWSYRLANTVRRNTLGAGDTVRGCLAYGLWTYGFGTTLHTPTPRGIEHILRASCALASLKCYVGSFVDFLQALESLRETDLWIHLWGFDENG